VSFVHEYFRSLTIRGNRKLPCSVVPLEGAKAVLTVVTLRVELVTDVIGEIGDVCVAACSIMLCIVCENRVMWQALQDKLKT
jgi:hypothetical protein